MLIVLLAALAAAQDPYRAVAGAPFLAYVGDRVQLSAEWSTGPEPRVFAWTQTEGPAAALDDPTAERPRFLAEAPGTYAFQVTVGDGDTASPPARSLVSVVDRDLRGDDAGCRSAPVPAGPVALLLLGAALARRRR
jgi:MYXO-CTERM domain-containing protein